MGGKRLFICYSRVDSQAVQSVAAECVQLGQVVWFDQQLSGGQPWWDTILENIRSCDCFMFALSPSSLQSRACRAELEYANALQRPILPVTVGDSVPDQLLPPVLAETQRVDLRQPHQLARALLALGPTPALASSLPTPPPVPISYLDEVAAVVDRRELTIAEQRNLVGELRSRLAQDEEREGALTLLQRLRQRSDVYASVATEVDELLVSLPPPRPPAGGQPPPPHERPEPAAPAPKRRTGLVVAVSCLVLVALGGVGAGVYVASKDDTDDKSGEIDDPVIVERTDPEPPDSLDTVAPVEPDVDITVPEPDIPEEPSLASLDGMFPGVDFSACDELTNVGDRVPPIEGARCYFPGDGVIAEFYNYSFEDFESDVGYWANIATFADSWNDGGPVVGRVLQVPLVTGQYGVLWTYDAYALSVLAYADPTSGADDSDVWTWWEAFDLHAL